MHWVRHGRRPLPWRPARWLPQPGLGCEERPALGEAITLGCGSPRLDSGDLESLPKLESSGYHMWHRAVGGALLGFLLPHPPGAKMASLTRVWPAAGGGFTQPQAPNPGTRHGVS